MKRLALLSIVLGVFVSACGSSSSTAPTTPTNPTFTAALSPANEVPAIVGAEAAGSGTVSITLNVTRDYAGTITAATADFVVTATGFPNGTSLTDAHIHGGAAGTNGGALVNLGLSAGSVTFPNGGGTFTRNGITVTADQASGILANPANFYFNIHTAANPGGVARGQLVLAQ